MDNDLEKLQWLNQIKESIQQQRVQGKLGDDHEIYLIAEDYDIAIEFLQQVFQAESYHVNNEFLYQWEGLKFRFFPSSQQRCCESGQVLWKILSPTENLFFDLPNQACITLDRAIDFPNGVTGFCLDTNDEPTWVCSAQALFQWTIEQFIVDPVDISKSPIEHWTEKKDIVRKKIIPVYTGIAAGIAAVPIPFSDAMLLIPCQTTMSLHILKAYELESVGPIVSSVISSTVISQLGRSTAASLIKMIPIVGSVTGAIINSGVASSFTWVLGMALSEIAFSFKKARLEGKEPDLEDFFSQLNLRNIMRGIDPSDYDDSYR